MSQSSNPTRIATTAAALATGLGIARSAHAAGSDVIKIALIGCGGRGTGAANDCLSSNDNVKIVAMADVFGDRLSGSYHQLKQRFPDKLDVPEEHKFLGFDAYHKAIACGVDSVMLTTPPGFRPIHYTAAIEAGKHVFMEKPCCVDAHGYNMLVKGNAIADAKGLKVAVGMQRRHSKEYIPVIQRIHDGEIGDVRLIRAYWNGDFAGNGFGNRKNGPKSEMEFQIRNWNVFRWLSGDHIVEQHVHNIDVCNWVMDDHPVEANGMGSRAVRKAAQTFDHHMVEFTYKSGAKFYSQCRQFAGCFSRVQESVVGTKGQIDRIGGNGSDGYQQEHVDLMAAIRNGTKLNDGHHGASSSMTGVLGRMASYSGVQVKWDDAIAKGPSELPERFALDAVLPAMPDADGNYEVPTPGIYKPY